MVSGTDIPEFGETFGVDVNLTEYSVNAYLIKSSIPGNILWPNDDVEFTIQLKNNTDKELFIDSKVEVISYGTRGRPSDIWTPQMFKIRQEERISFNVHGGGTELWRSKVPGMPHKHFFPRQNPSPLDGPVKAGKLKITRDGNTRIVEAAIPWSEITAVKKRLDNKQKIKILLSYK